MQRNEHEHKTEETGLTLDDKKKKCLILLKKFIESLMREFPGDLGPIEITTAHKAIQKGEMVLEPDLHSGIAIIYSGKGDSLKILDEIAKQEGFTLSGGSRYQTKEWAMKQRGFHTKNTDDDIEKLLKRLQFDINAFLKSSAPPSAPGAGAPGFFEAKSPSSALKDEKFISFIAEIFAGLPARSVTFKDDIICFKGDQEEAEKLFAKVRTLMNDKGLSPDTIMNNVKIKKGESLDADKILNEIEPFKKPRRFVKDSITFKFMYELQKDKVNLSLEKFLRYVELKNRELCQVNINAEKIFPEFVKLRESPAQRDDTTLP